MMAQVVDLGMDQDMLRFVLIVGFAGVASIGLAFARWR